MFDSRAGFKKGFANASVFSHRGEVAPDTGCAHGSGLLFGYAADGKVDPDWLVVPDGGQPRAWRLLHTVSKEGGTRCSVGSTVR